MSTITRWRRNPKFFVKEALGVKPEKWQVEALNALKTNDRVAIRSGHGVGKSALLAWAILWWLTTRYPAKIACTANTSTQLSDVLWGELDKWYRLLAPEFKKYLELKSDRLELIEDPKQCFAVARTARKEQPEAFQGYHCLSDDHTILTKRGWLGIDEIKRGDMVLSAPPNGENAEWMPVDAVHSYPYIGDLNVYDSRSVSFAVTDEHQFPTKYDQKTKSWKLRRFNDLASQFMVRRVTHWEGEDFKVPYFFHMDPIQFAEFIGFWIGDGGVRQHSNGDFYEVLLYQTKHTKYVEKLLEGIRYSRKRDYFSISNKKMAKWLIHNVDRYGYFRTIPRKLLDAKPEILEALCRGLWMAEGSHENGEKRQFYNSNPVLMGQVQEILIKLGRPATMGINSRAGREAITANGDVVRTNADCYVTSWVHPFDSMVKMKDVRKEHYSGHVWCISTEYQTFYTKRNGRVFLSGNSPNMLFIIDEASGVDDIIFEVGRGSMSSKGAKTIMTGNPTRTSGYFYNAFHSMKNFWHTMKVACEDSTMVSQQYIDECKEEYGEDSNAYRVRVLGEFPVEGDDVVIPLHLVESAIARNVESVGEEVWGLDVARFGDDRTALAKRCGNVLTQPIQWVKNKNLMQVAGWVINEYNEAKVKPVAIFTDVIGVGAGVVDRLAEQNLPVSGINVAETPAFGDKFMRMRDELWWSARDWFYKLDCKIPDDGALLAELTIPTYNFTSGGKIKVEGKDEIKKRTRKTASGLGKSPDLADAFCLTFASGTLITRRPRRLVYPRIPIV